MIKDMIYTFYNYLFFPPFLPILDKLTVLSDGDGIKRVERGRGLISVAERKKIPNTNLLTTPFISRFPHHSPRHFHFTFHRVFFVFSCKYFISFS